MTERVEAEAALRRTHEAEVSNLRALLPICASCKSIRDDRGYWDRIEAYMLQHAGVQFTHTYCPTCLDKLYPENEEGDAVAQSG